MDYRFVQISKDDINWRLIESSYDSTIYKTFAWFDYLYKWKGVQPFVVEVSTNRVIGYFIGELINKVVRIVGSPFEGVGTGHQGLSMLITIDSKERLTIYEQLSKWIFKNRYAEFVQIEDWNLSMSDLEDTKYVFEKHEGYMIDLTKSEEELYRNLHQKSCRYSINKSQKLGVTIREAANVTDFVDIYYAQLKEVFKKQGLVPTYDKACVQSLVESLYPNNILLLEAVTLDGEIAATGLFPAEKNMAVFWGGASYQKFQNQCPNEPLIWEAIKIWRRRGVKTFDMCGVRSYKLKFGPVVYVKPRIIFAKYHFLIIAKRLMKKLYYACRKFAARFRK